MSVVQMPKSQNVVEDVWSAMQAEAKDFAKEEKALASFLYGSVINQESFCRAMANYMADKLATPEFNTLHMRQLILEVCRSDERVIQGAALDLIAVRERDPACHSYLQAFLYFKGFMALANPPHRPSFAGQRAALDGLSFQSRSAELFGVDINPGAQFGFGIMLDHATGFVAGETSVVGNGCSILHGVTLGGTGKGEQDRHPKIGKNVMIGAGAKILGNIKIGDSARIASGSVVLKDVMSNCTVAGVPAKPVGGPCCENPAAEMNQILGEND